VTVGNMVHDLSDRPTIGPIPCVELAVAQTLDGFAQIAGQSLQFRNPGVEFGAPNRCGRTVRPYWIAEIGAPEIWARAIDGIWFSGT
jgi:hypothetical protein